MSQDNLIQDKAQREVVYDVDQSYWSIVKRQFRKNRAAVWSMRFLMVIIFVGVFANFLANDKPIVCKYNGEIYFPVLRETMVKYGASWPKELVNIVDWKTQEYDFSIWPLVPYAQDELDYANAQNVSPIGPQEVESSRWRHWFGTDDIGRDVLSGMIHGTTIAMMVGVVSMSLASIIGIILGALAGYYGDNRLKMSWLKVLLLLLTLPIAWFYAFSVRSHIFADAFEIGMGSFFGKFLFSLLIFFGILLIAFVIGTLLEKIKLFNSKINIPVDIIVSRAIEVLISIPKLLLIMSIVAIAKPSIMLVMVIIGVTGWTGIARFTRGELLRVRNLEYMEAAQSLGYSEFRSIFKHALPNSLAPVLIAVAFGVAGAILTESFLSFLGIGVEAEIATWGKMLSLARKSPEAWWLAIIPGFAIFITVTIFNLMGEGLTDALDPKMKQ